MIRLGSMLPQAFMIGIMEMVNLVGPEKTCKWLTYIGKEMAMININSSIFLVKFNMNLIINYKHIIYLVDDKGSVLNSFPCFLLILFIFHIFYYGKNNKHYGPHYHPNYKIFH